MVFFFMAVVLVEAQDTITGTTAYDPISLLDSGSLQGLESDSRGVEAPTYYPLQCALTAVKAREVLCDDYCGPKALVWLPADNIGPTEVNNRKDCVDYCVAVANYLVDNDFLCNCELPRVVRVFGLQYMTLGNECWNLGLIE